jgi:hypothetical protein
MFDDFGDQQQSQEGRGRQSVSAVLSLGIFGLIALGVGGAITAHQVHKRRAEQDVDVAFDDLPKVEAPKPKPLVQAASVAQRKAAARRPVVAPKAIPKETPEEAEGNLGDAQDTGPVEGFTDQGGPTVVAPPPAPAPALPPPPPPVAAASQERETISRPVFVSGCRAPVAPEGLLSSAATIQIDVRMLIGPDGRVLSAAVLQSNPLIPNELILACARNQVFEPAHLPDGTAVPYPFKRRFVFRPAQA